MSDELKQCPFCGGEARIIHSDNGWFLKQAHDDNCWLSDATTVKAAIGEWDESKAIAAWNTRTHDMLSLVDINGEVHDRDEGMA